MYKIINSKVLGTGIKQFEIEAPRIARKQQPGQFVIVRLHEHGERIPLTIKGSDPERGTVTIVVQAIGKTTHLFNMLETGDAILDIVGPLGHPSEIKNYGTVVLVAGSVGTAMAFPTAVALKKAGNEVIVIEGARRKDLIVLEDEVRAALDEFYVMTDDGSHGEQGLVTKKLEDLLNTRKVDFVLACGPVPMMRAIKDMTLPRNIQTMVSLNSIMVDGTGMCGGCRVLVGNTSKFACVDGPEFDAAMVNFDVLTQRNAAYREKEKQSLDAFLADPSRDLALVKKNLEHIECAAVAGGSDAR